MGVSKIVVNTENGAETLIDLTNDDVKSEYLLKGHTAHGADGEPVVGTCDYDANTQGVTASESEVLNGKKFVKNGVEKIGTMPNNGGVTGAISDKDGYYTIPQGCHDGSGKVGIADTEKQKLIAQNIRKGVMILGVNGGMTGTEDANPQAKEVISSMVEQIVLPDSGYNYLSQVTVKPIPYVENENTAGGITVTIG